MIEVMEKESFKLFNVHKIEELELRNKLFEKAWFWSRLGFLPDPPGMPGADEAVTQEEITRFVHYHREMAENGITTHSTILPVGWVDDGVYDYTETDKVLEAILSANSDILYVPRVKFNPPIGWLKKHPEDVCVYYGGPTDPQEIAAIVGSPKHDILGYDIATGQYGGKDKKPRPNIGGVISNQSFASSRWLADAITALQKLIAHIQASPWADRVKGYHVAFGISGEAVMWGGWAGKFADYSNTMQKTFYQWGLENYGSAKQLERAWGSKSIHDGAVLLPTPEERSPNNLNLENLFRTGQRGALTADFERFISSLSANSIIALSSAVKKSAGAEMLTGAFYAYFAGVLDAARNGHLAIERLLQSPDVDFLAAPMSYICRNVGEPSLELACARSINRRGKVWINELDVRTHLAVPDAGFGRVDTLEETNAVLWREFASSRASGSRYWWMDLFGGWFASPDIMSTIRQIGEVETKLGTENKSIAQIAVVVDENSFYCASRQDIWHPDSVGGLIYSMRSLGAPVDIIRLADLLQDNPPEYKMLAFANVFSINAEQREILEKYFETNKPTVVWQFASGIISDGKMNIENCKVWTGFSLKEQETKQSPVITLNGLPDEINSDVKSFAPGKWVLNDKEVVRVNHNTNENYIPRWDLPSFTVLPEKGDLAWGTWPDGEAALTGRQTGNGWRIYSALSGMPPALLRFFATLAGCHLYVKQDCAVYAGDNFCCLHTQSSGEYNIKLHAKGNWKDPVSGNVWQDVCSIKKAIAAKETLFLYKL